MEANEVVVRMIQLMLTEKEAALLKTMLQPLSWDTRQQAEFAALFCAKLEIELTKAH